MHLSRHATPTRATVDPAPPAGWVHQSCGRRLGLSRLKPASASGKDVTPAENGITEGSGTDGVPNAWGAALAAKARRPGKAAQITGRNQRLDTVEPSAVSIAPGTADGASAAGPVVVVDPVDPIQGPETALRTRRTTAAGVQPGLIPDGQHPYQLQQGAKKGAKKGAKPPITFTHAPLAQAGRTAAAAATATAAAASGRRPPAASRTPMSYSFGATGAPPQPFGSLKPAAGSVRQQQQQQAAAAAATAPRPSPRPPRPPPSPGTPSSAARSPAPPLPPAPGTPREESAAGSPTSTVQPASPTGKAAGGKVDPLAISFAQVMGSGRRRGGEGLAAGGEEDVVDFDWEPDPDLDVVEEEAAEDAKRREQERLMDPDRVSKEREAARAAAEEAVLQAYEPGGAAPQPYVGPVKAERVRGRGFGLVAQEDVGAGQLLLVSAPVVLERGSPGELPQLPPLLAATLRLLRIADGVGTTSPGSKPAPSSPSGHGPPAPTPNPAQPPAELGDALALASLFSGQPRGPQDQPPADLAAWRAGLEGRLGRLGPGPGPGTSAAPGAGSGPNSDVAGKGRPVSVGKGAGAVGAWSPQRVMSLLQLNLLAEGTQDGAAALASGEALSSAAGVWPEVALANHSCAPNAVAVMLRDRLVLRAARAIPMGREMVINWLGTPGVMVPVRQRRRELAQMYGFTCRCARCVLEASEAMSVPFLFADAERDTRGALGVVGQALAAKDLGALTAALQPLQRAVDQLVTAIHDLGEQVDLTGGREGAVAVAMMRQAAGDEEGQDDGDGEGGEGQGGAGGVLAAAATRLVAKGTASPASAAEGGKELAAQRREGTDSRGAAGAGAGGRGEGEGGGRVGGKREQVDGAEGPVADRLTAEAWLFAGMLLLQEALVNALATRAAWLGVEVGPGWHWPHPQPVAVPASSAAAAVAREEDEAQVKVIVMRDEELEEQQATSVAELMGALATYMDTVTQVLPGSEPHIQAATRLLSLSRRFLGPYDKVSRDLYTAAYDAHVLRYGKVDEETFERLMTAGIEAMEDARRREARLLQQRGDAADEYDDHDADEEEDQEGGAAKARRSDGRRAAAAGDDHLQQLELAAMFREDQRIRAAAVTAAAARAPPRSWPLAPPLRRNRGGGSAAPPPLTRQAAAAAKGDVMGVRTEAAAAAKGDVMGVRTEAAAAALPEGVVAEGDGDGGRERVQAEVEEEAMRELARIRKRGTMAGGRGPAAAVSASAAAARAEAEAVNRLFKRDDDDEDDDSGSLDGRAGATKKQPPRPTGMVGKEAAMVAAAALAAARQRAGGGSGGGALRYRARVSPGTGSVTRGSAAGPPPPPPAPAPKSSAPPESTSLDSLLNVFPGLSAEGSSGDAA